MHGKEKTSVTLYFNLFDALEVRNQVKWSRYMRKILILPLGLVVGGRSEWFSYTYEFDIWDQSKNL
jgi:hypothetical protein